MSIAFLLQQPALQQLMLLLAVVLVEQYLPWPDKYHPLSLFRLLAINMARKVNPRQARSKQQRLLSGSLAIIMLVVPVLVLLQLLIYMADFPWFFHGFALLVALRLQPCIQAGQRIEQALLQGKKQLARESLQPWVIRETSRLSPLGIGKAQVETLLLRFNYQYVTVLFWYLLLGGVAALGYRLLYELQQAWNSKQATFAHFGKPAARLTHILQWLPVRMGIIGFVFAQHLPVLAQAWRTRQKGWTQAILCLHWQGSALGIELGGPAIYQGNKVRRPRVGGTREIKLADMARARKAIYRCKTLFFIIFSTISVLSMQQVL